MRAYRLIPVCTVCALAASALAEDLEVACVWDGSGAVTILPTPAGSESEAYGINDAGHVVGFVTVSGNRQPALWYHNGVGSYTRHNLGTLPGGTSGSAWDINNSNWIVGRTVKADGVYPFYYQPTPSVIDGTMHEIVVTGSTAGYVDGVGRRISDSGWVCGTYQAADYVWHAFRYEAAGAKVFEGLGTIGEPAPNYTPRSSGIDVDTIGRVVGYSGVSAFEGEKACVFEGGAIGLIDGIASGAKGISDTGGHVVGMSAADTDTAAVVTLDGPGSGIQELGKPAGSYYVVTSDVNNGRDICGRAAFSLFEPVWYDQSAGEWKLLDMLNGTSSLPRAISNSQRIAGSVTYDSANPLPVGSGGGTVVIRPTGFSDGGFTAAGMDGAVPLSRTIELENPSFVPDVNGDDMVTVRIAYDEADVLAMGLDEVTLKLYWFNETAGLWELAGAASNIGNGSMPPVTVGPATDLLGDYGVDPLGNYVWANVDHASTYGVGGVPEPASLTLLGLGALAVLRRRS